MSHWGFHEKAHHRRDTAGLPDLVSRGCRRIELLIGTWQTVSDWVEGAGEQGEIGKGRGEREEEERVTEERGRC
jgi:hypothetical protein